MPTTANEGAPKDRGFPVTPHDTNPLPSPTAHIYVGLAGDLSYVPSGDTSANPTVLVLKSLAIGWHPVRARIIKNTGTSAQFIVGYY